MASLAGQLDKSSSDKARRRLLGRRSPEPPAWIGYAFIAPNLLGFLAFTLLPLLFAAVVAFSDWDVISGIDKIRWIGLRNFEELLGDPKFWESARITLYYISLAVPLTNAAGMGLALALNGPVLGRNLLRLVFFIPFVANTVAIAATWILMYHPRSGPVNALLRAVGITNLPAWLASSAWALPGLILMAVWQGAGYNSIIYLAALQDIPEELYEAAELDGAGSWQRFRFVTFPLIRPTTFFLLVTGLIGASQSFGMINLMTAGGPGRSTTVLSYYVFQNAFQYYRFGYAAAMAWVMFAGVLLLTIGLWWFQRRQVTYSA